MGAPEVVSLIALLVVLAMNVVFIVYNHLFISWRSNPWGRHVMTFSYVIAGTLTLGLARLFLGDYPGRRWIIAGFYVALAGVMIQRVWLVVSQHRRGLHQSRGRPPAPKVPTR